MTQRMILVVDDEVETIELVQAVLNRNGFAVGGALNGPDGLRLARDAAPAMIMIDIMLPELNGFELCRQLRADPMTTRIPRVIISARDSLADQIEALESGADRYLVKPMKVRTLVALIEDLIGLPPDSGA